MGLECNLFLGAELVDVKGELALEVGCLVFRNSFLGSQFVEHLGDGYQFSLSFSFVGQFAQIANGVAGSLSVVAVAKTTSCSLTDSFKR